MKRCKQCGVERSSDSFYRCDRNADGLRGKCKSCTADDAKKWREDNPDAYREIYQAANHRANLKSRFGITPEEFDALSEKSNGVCAMCGQMETRARRLCLDHDHRTGAIRGFLCSRCNLVLGQVDDQVSLLGSAIRYLTAPPLAAEAPSDVRHDPIGDLTAERIRQDVQWGGPAHDDSHGPSDWIAFINHQMTRLADTITGEGYEGLDDRDEYISRLIKIAALALAASESFGRKKASHDALVMELRNSDSEAERRAADREKAHEFDEDAARAFGPPRDGD